VPFVLSGGDVTTPEWIKLYLKNGRTFAYLRRKYPLVGIGFFCELLMLLANTPGHHVDMSDDIDRDYLLDAMNIEESQARMLIDELAKTGKVDAELWARGVVFMPSCIDSLSEFYRRKKGDVPTTKSLRADILSTTCRQPVDTLALRGEEKRGEENRGDGTASLLSIYRALVEAHLPTTSWPKPEKQLEALREVCRMTEETQPTTPIETTEAFAGLVIAEYERRKREGRGTYWKNASWEPVEIQRRFGDIVSGLADTYADKLREKQDAEEYARIRGFKNEAD
jgi:hypothetical protein